MKRSSCLLAAACLPVLLCSAAPVIAQTVPAAAPQVERPREGVITLFQSTNRVMVMMRIGDGELVPMVFDTGSDGHSIDRLLVKRYRMKRVGDTIEVDGTTGKERRLATVAIPNVTLGGMPVGTIDASALDYDRSDAMGIISSEMFEGSLVYLELAKNRARIVPKTAATLPVGPAVPYVRDIPTIDIVMPDGSTLPAHFDTGYNAALSLPIELMDKVPLVAPAKVVGRFKSINTEGDVYGGRIKGTIRIGSVVLDNPDVTFLGDLANIGLPVIRRLTLVIDPQENRSWTLDPSATSGAAK